MFCKNCGREIADTVKFCAFCGTLVQPEDVSAAVPVSREDSEDEATLRDTGVKKPESQTEPKPQPESRVEPLQPDNGSESPKAETPAAESEAPVVPVIPVVPLGSAPGNNGSGYAAGGSGYYAQGTADEQPTAKNHNFLVLIIIALIAVVVIAAVIFIAKGLFGGKKTVSKIFYLDGEELTATLDVTKDEPEDVEIAKIKNADWVGNFLVAQLSEEGTYLYYWSKISDDYEGTLCRIPVGKVSAKESSNEKATVEIDTKVSAYTPVGEDSVLYMRKGDQLMYYTGGESYEIADDIYEYVLTEDKSYVIFCTDDSDSDILYAAKLEKNTEVQEIDDKVSYVVMAADKDYILYAKEGKDDTYDFYTAAIGEDPEVVAEDVHDIVTYDVEDKSFYYVKAESTEHTLYDYVTDPYAESDAGVTEPQEKDYMVQTDETTAISEWDQEYYSSSSEFYEDLTEYYYYDSDLGMYKYYNRDDYEYYYYDNTTGAWYHLDDTAYDAAYDAYYDVCDRLYLREELKENTLDDTIYKLHYYASGTDTEICGSMDYTVCNDSNAVVYTKADVKEVSAVCSIDDFSYAYEVNDYMDSDEGDGVGYFCSVAGSAETELTDFDSADGVYVFDGGSKVAVRGDYDEDGTYLIMAYTVSASGLKDGGEVTKEGFVCGNQDGNLYYVEDYDTDDYSGKLYRYDGKNATLLAKDICVDGGMLLTDDGKIIGMTDYDGGECDLSIFGKDGEGKRIAKGITGYYYLGSNSYLVVKDYEDIYYVNRKGEETRIARGVDGLWIPGNDDGEYAGEYISVKNNYGSAYFWLMGE